MQNAIVTVCGDPGGANALAPVIRLLEKRDMTPTNYAYNQGVQILDQHGIKHVLLPEQIDEALVVKILTVDRPSYLLTSTSHNEKNWEKLFIASAKSLNINSLAILDFWSNYALRFSNPVGQLIYLPDTIAVMDERAKAEMIAEGIPPQSILVTGQPAFDSLTDCRQKFSSAKRQLIRQSLGLKKEGLLIVFASQPLSQLYGKQYLGYDEHSVLEEVISSLEKISKKFHKEIALLIRPHPRESMSDYIKYHSDVIKIIVSAKGNNLEYVMAADLLLGMTTVLLVEACYLQCMVLSLQPGLKQPDTLPSNAWGASIAVYQKEQIMLKLEEYLLDKQKREKWLDKLQILGNTGNAATNIANWLSLKIKRQCFSCQ